jgi:hypothetical protein
VRPASCCQVDCRDANFSSLKLGTTTKANDLSVVEGFEKSVVIPDRDAAVRIALTMYQLRRPRSEIAHAVVFEDATAGVEAARAGIGFADAIERWSKWALAEADRIDPVSSARFLDTFEENGNAN